MLVILCIRKHTKMGLLGVVHGQTKQILCGNEVDERHNWNNRAAAEG